VSPGKTSSSPATERLARLVEALQAKRDVGALLEELGMSTAQRASFMTLAQRLLRRAEQRAPSATELALAVAVLVALRTQDRTPSGQS